MATSADEDPPLHPRRKTDKNCTCPRAGRKDVRELLQECWDLGCLVLEAGNGHFKVYPPDGARMIPVPGTPSSPKTLTNKRMQLRRFDVLVKK